jgi:hypothetical protein
MSRKASLRAVPQIFIAGLFIGLLSCGRQTVWSTKAVSPDGQWEAGARTQVWHGPGVGTAASSVYLARTDDPHNSTDIVSYMGVLPVSLHD